MNYTVQRSFFLTVPLSLLSPDLLDVFLIPTQFSDQVIEHSGDQLDYANTNIFENIPVASDASKALHCDWLLCVRNDRW